VLLFLLAINVMPGHAVTVTNNADSGAGSLRQAVIDTLAGGIIDFSPGLSNITLGSEIQINKDLTIQGPGARNLTINGNFLTRAFKILSATSVTITDLSIINGVGAADGGGGGIQNSGTLTLRDVSILDNSAPGGSDFGGGIANYGVLNLENVTMAGNGAAAAGGAIYNSGASSIFITNSTITANTAAAGGAIYNYETLDIRNSTIVQNSTTTGAAIDHEFGIDLSIYNTILTGNSTADLYAINAAPTVVHNSMIDVVIGSLGTPVATLTGPGLTPMLGPLGNNGGPTDTHALLPGSPALNSGESATCTLNDQRTVPRPQGATCDIGAYEARTGQVGGSTQGVSVSGTAATAYVATLAGLAGNFGSTNGTGTTARFNTPYHLTYNGANLYVADGTNNVIREINPASGAVTTLATVDGVPNPVNLVYPVGITADGPVLYVSESNRIRRIVIGSGLTTTIAGTGAPGFADGPGLSATFNNPMGLTTDGLSLFVADTNNSVIRRIDLFNNTVTTLAGIPGAPGAVDGAWNVAKFDNPQGITTDGVNLYVADTSNLKVRKVMIATGQVATLAGDGVSGSVDNATGTLARFKGPLGITSDGSHLFVTDGNDMTVRFIDIASTQVGTLAGTTASTGSTDGIGAAARFNGPWGITTNGASLFVSEATNHTIRKIGVMPAIAVSPLTYNFNSVPVGGNATWTVTITNNGTANLTTSIAISGTDYTMDNTGGGTPCNSNAPTLTAGTFCTVSVKVTPTSIAALNGTLTITSNDTINPSVQAQFTATGTAGTCNWNIGDGLWSDTTKWSCGRVPVATDTVNITTGGTYTITLDVNGVMAAMNLGAATGTQTLSSSGTNLTLNGASTIAAGGALLVASGTIGGTGSLTNNGAMLLNIATITIPLINNGILTAAGPSPSDINIGANAVVNSGTITATNTINLNFGAGGTFTNNGNLIADAGPVTNSFYVSGVGGTFTNTATSTIKGTGKVQVFDPMTSSTNYNGNISPAGAAVNGILSFIGDMFNLASNIFNIDISGSTTAGTDYDQVNVTGGVSLAGTTLNVALNGYTPVLGDSFTILTCTYGCDTNPFTTTNLPALPTGKAWNITYNPTSVVLSVTIPYVIDNPSPLPPWTINQTGYYEMLTASGGAFPYLYAITAGALPPGMALTGGDVLDGTPTAAGTYSFDITVTDTVSKTAVKNFTIVINPMPVFVTSVLPDWTANLGGYSQNIVTSGGTGTVTITVSSGKVPPGMILSGGNLSGTPTTPGSYPFTLIGTDSTGAITSMSYTMTINPEPLPATYIASASAAAGGSIAPASATVTSGTSTTFTVTPLAGYSIANVSGCGGTLAGTIFTTAQLTADCSITASFNQDSYTVTATAGTGGSISPVNASVLPGDSATFTVATTSGYTINSVSGCGGTLNGNIFTTGPVTAPCSISASFATNTITVSAGAGNGGSISPANAAVAPGATTTFSIATSPGYSIVNVSGCGGTLNGSQFTTGPVTSTCSVTATFSLNSYTVTPGTSGNGSVSPATPMVISYGSTQSFTLTPETGYHISSIGGNCGGNLNGNIYTTIPVSGDCSVYVNFAINTYAIVPTAVNGTISPATATVPHGSAQSFTITPHAGYFLRDVLVDGASVGPVTTYQFTNVVGPHTIKGVFSSPDGVLDPGNDTGEPTIADAVIAMGAALGDVSLTPTQFLRADVAPIVNGRSVPDGVFDLGDVLLILRRSVRLATW
jgi:hypothetical protein